VQEEDVDADQDDSTSEGIFIYCPSCTGIKEGDRVRVTGTVAEFFGMTQISALPAGVVVTEGTTNHLSEVTPAHITLPIPAGVDINAYYEAREGMLVQFDELTVSEYFQLFRYGQVTLVSGARPRTFTEDNAPSVSGLAAHLDSVARRQVILDDDRDGDEAPLNQPGGQQAVYWPHVNGGFSLGTQGQDFFRGGDKVQNLVGVLQWSRPGSIQTPASTWRVRPSNSYPVTFTPVNLRPQTPPDVGGSIRVVGMNLLNYFTTIDTTSSTSSGPCGTSHTLDCRGADSQAELDRQTARAAKVICDLNPDVASFMELENNDVPSPTTTINYLLNAVNQRCGARIRTRSRTTPPARSARTRSA
jgi:predicted extracellular nuclease